MEDMITEYDVIVILTGLITFAITLGSACVKLSRSITENRSAVQELHRTVEQLRETLQEQHREHRQTHGELFARLRAAENCLAALKGSGNPPTSTQITQKGRNVSSNVSNL